MKTKFAQRAKDIVSKYSDNKKEMLSQLDALRREQFEHENQMANGGSVNMEREMKRGIEVEHEHKPTLDFIKKYYKDNGKFPTIGKLAKSIAVDHIEDYKKVPDRQNDSYYKGLIDNKLSDELSEYAFGGDIHPLDAPNSMLESIRMMAEGGNLYPDGGPVIPQNDEAKSFFLNYLSSPKYKERIIGSGYNGPQQVINDRMSSLIVQKPEYWNTEDNVKSQLKESLTGVTTSSSNSRTPMRPIVNYNQADRMGLKPEEIMAHEISHKIGSSEYSIPGETPIRSLLNPSDLKDLETRSASFRKIIGDKQWTPEFSTKTKGITHESSGYELKSDIDALRYMLNRDKIYNAGTEDFSDQHLQKANDLYKNNYIYKRLRNNYSDDDMKYLMNKIAMNNQKQNNLPVISAHGGNMNEYKEGGGIHIDPSKRGTFRAQASRMGMSIQAAASKILNAPEGKYSPAMRKKANFAKNFAKEDGGELNAMSIGGPLIKGMPYSVSNANVYAGGGIQSDPLSVRNMNPGNIIDPVTGTFKVFKTPEEGFGELTRDLSLKLSGKSPAYKSRYGDMPVTPERLAEVWSPAKAVGNSPESTSNYGKYIAHKLGINPWDTIPNSSDSLSRVAQAISEFESGNRSGVVSGAKTPSEFSDRDIKSSIPIQGMNMRGFNLPGKMSPTGREITTYQSDIDKTITPEMSFVTDIKTPQLATSTLIENSLRPKEPTETNWNDIMRYSPVAFNALSGLLTKRGHKLPTNISLPTISPSVISPQQLSTSPIREAIGSQYRGGINALSGATGGSPSVMRSGLTGLALSGARGAGEALNDIYSRNAILRGEADKYNAQSATDAGRINLEQANRAMAMNREAQIANTQDIAARDMSRRQSLAAAFSQLGQIGKEKSQESLIRKLYGYDPKTGKKISK